MRETFTSNSENKLLREFEFEVLESISNLGDRAYGAEICRNLSKKLDRTVRVSQVYSSLSRLETKGFVYFTENDPRPVKGGRSQKIFHLTEHGHTARLRTARALAAADLPEFDISNTVGSPA